MKLIAGCKTCTGNFREMNQDAVILRVAEKEKKYFAILGVCDGIGGLEKGEVVAEIAVKRITEWFDSEIEWLDIVTVEESLMFAHLKDLADNCNEIIKEYCVVHRIIAGTTLSLLMILRDQYYIIQVGDSRVYRYRAQKLTQLTVDASVTKLKNGRLKAYLDNYLGKDNELWFTSTVGTCEKKDILLVCSDGLYHKLQKEDLAKIERDIFKNKKVEEACTDLIQRVLNRGERDNVTVGIIAML